MEEFKCPKCGEVQAVKMTRKELRTYRPPNATLWPEIILALAQLATSIYKKHSEDQDIYFFCHACRAVTKLD